MKNMTTVHTLLSSFLASTSKFATLLSFISSALIYTGWKINIGGLKTKNNIATLLCGSLRRRSP